MLGFAVVSKENNKIKYEYHDYLFEILSHDSLFLGKCLLNLLKKDRFKGIKNPKVWSDNGNHFRLYKSLNNLFKEILKIN